LAGRPQQRLRRHLLHEHVRKGISLVGDKA
jgi:hypothetical protein